ncbi:HDOD domain protein [Legionella rubrilucens]|uniref:HDOD domain protein n=1 Tax=Legionella rubrilucens TaxID=458 RepID=A0A0W0Y1N2_9GAMM|nr:HDOD domain-containing protein [Legionella rubrilucens]KTD50516.1 HDOD domain protein [Legionella rubrilucens]
MIFIAILLMILVLLFYLGVKPHKRDRKSPLYRSPSPLPQEATLIIPSPELPGPPVITPSPAVTPPVELAAFHLITRTECQAEVVDNILKMTQAMPRPHPLLKALTSNLDNPEKLYQVVKSDAEIAAKILRTVNSSGFYLTKKITHLNYAILYLGSNMVKNIALQCVMKANVQSPDKRLNQALKIIWAQGFLASSLVLPLAKQLGLSHAAELGTRALLAYIGNLAIITYKPQLAYYLIENYSLFDRTKIEQQELGLNAAIVGSELAQAWQLPQEIVEGIRHHLLPLGVPPAHCPLEGDALRDCVITYVCCRAAEIIINQGLTDVADLNWADERFLELFYLPAYLHRADLKTCLDLTKKQVFRSEVNKMIQKIERPVKAVRK